MTADAFYDHVPPPPGMGIRVPMVIVSPYAKPGYTDSNVASFASILAYTEHNFGLPSLGQADATSYDYSDSFDYSQAANLNFTRLTRQPVPAASRTYLSKTPHFTRRHIARAYPSVYRLHPGRGDLGDAAYVQVIHHEEGDHRRQEAHIRVVAAVPFEEEDESS